MQPLAADQGLRFNPALYYQNIFQTPHDLHFHYGFKLLGYCDESMLVCPDSDIEDRKTPQVTYIEGVHHLNRRHPEGEGTMPDSIYRFRWTKATRSSLIAE
jgi:hypothetical protein